MRTLPLLTLVLVIVITSVDGGKTLRLTVKVRQSDGSITTPADIAWLSEDGAIASVDAGGTVRGLRAGRVQILATWHNSRGFSLVTVLESAPPDGKQPKPNCTEKGVAGAGAEIPKDDTCF